MHLVALEEVRASIGFDDITDVNLALTRALNAATVSLEAKIRTKFALNENVVDVFFLPSVLRNSSPQQPSSYFEVGAGTYMATLKLSQGFLTHIPVLTYSPTLSGLRDDPPTIEEEHLLVDKEAGVIRVSGLDLSRMYVEVGYSAGFSAKAAPNDHIFDEVPTWLSEAAALSSIISLDAYNPTLRHDDRVEAQAAGRELHTQLETLIEKYIRYFPDARTPE